MSIKEIKKEGLTESVCRLCFEEREQYQLIFMDEYSSSLKEWIENLTTLKIMEVPNAPSSLCSECKNALENFESFREMCFTNDRAFREMFTQDDSRNDHHMSVLSEVEADATIAQVDTFEITEITVEYPDVKTEVVHFLNSEENNDNESAKTDQSHESENIHQLIKTRQGPKTKSRICSFCGKKFPNATRLSWHVKIHIKDRPHKCQVCDKSFLCPSALRRHEYTHGGLKPYACDKCPERYTQTAHLLRHQKVHEKKRPTKFRKDTAEKDSSHVQEPIKKVELPLKPAKPNDIEDNRQQCTICNKFVLRMKEHLLVHSNIRPHRCHYCNKGFLTKYKLAEHIRHHTKEKPFGCDRCGRVFANTRDLKFHIRTHTLERRFMCTQCPKAFITSVSLRRHTETHSGLKPFSCDICQFRFGRKHHLERHLKMHARLAQTED